jgi:hypothetical protein
MGTDNSWPDKGIWEYPRFFIGMFVSFAIESPIFGIVVLLAVWQFYGRWLALAAGGIFGAFIIWRIVRWVNHRDDPRVKPPAPNPSAPPESN